MIPEQSYGPGKCHRGRAQNPIRQLPPMGRLNVTEVRPDESPSGENVEFVCPDRAHVVEGERDVEKEERFHLGPDYLYHGDSLPSRDIKRELIGRIVGFLREADADMDRIEEDAASRLQLHRTDFRCLDILSRGRALTAGQLGAAAGLTTGATTALLDRLEARGYVRRVRDNTDRRRVRIEVTRSARGAVAPVFKPLISLSTKRFSAFTLDELEIVLRFAECNRR